VPFAALVDATTQRYLVQDAAVTIIRRRARSDAATQRELASPAAGGGVGFAPFPGELPATRGEVDAFRALLPRAEIRLGAEATEGNCGARSR
jgi:CHAT domain-containing protein